MAAKPKKLPKKYEPNDATALWKCSCGNDATRAVYQHCHQHEAGPNEKDCDAMFTWEIPAYVDSHGKLCKMRCPLCNDKDVAPVLVKCGDCRRIVKAP
jgi:hypothetical protein